MIPAAATEHPTPVPKRRHRDVDEPFPALGIITRLVSAQALLAFRGNCYSVPPGLAGTTPTVTHRFAYA